MKRDNLVSENQLRTSTCSMLFHSPAMTPASSQWSPRYVPYMHESIQGSGSEFAAAIDAIRGHRMPASTSSPSGMFGLRPSGSKPAYGFLPKWCDTATRRPLASNTLRISGSRPRTALLCAPDDAAVYVMSAAIEANVKEAGRHVMTRRVRIPQVHG